MTIEPTVESALKELREMFPKYKYFGVDIAEGAPRARVKVIVGESYYSSRVHFFNSDTLNEAMAQVRKWKDQQS